MGLFERIQSKLELFRLEQRYTNRRNRRTAFSSDAIYVDGEYVYASSNTTGSSSRSDQTTQSMQSASRADKRRSTLPAESYVDHATWTDQRRPSVPAESPVENARVDRSASRRSVAAFPSESFADIEARIAESGEGRDEASAELPQRRWSRNWGKTKREDKRRSMAVVSETRWE